MKYIKLRIKKFKKKKKKKTTTTTITSEFSAFSHTANLFQVSFTVEWQLSHGIFCLEFTLRLGHILQLWNSFRFSRFKDFGKRRQVLWQCCSFGSPLAHLVEANQGCHNLSTYFRTGSMVGYRAGSESSQLMS